MINEESKIIVFMKLKKKLKCMNEIKKIGGSLSKSKNDAKQVR